jgi:hypothetical protein
VAATVTFFLVASGVTTDILPVASVVTAQIFLVASGFTTENF